ncbi:DNA polymerase III subunit beta family protein [Mesomycoplasma neurolyticum]|uniref:DNA polymerase III beta subunit n=1 Tax=Mesomycoplasma neurolyticum TaxID=2120 RepID=A0A449A613_9BACT|nr:hypothetical protein [Mesomycoplasma neurolyticum]VEU59662.1 DNA polymerase III beta subunit [Mesomycoplasma neurolyticum]
MKFTILKKDLDKNIENISSAINNANFLIPLRGVYLKLTSEGLYFIGTDNELTIRSFVETDKLIKVDELGEILVNHLLFKNVVKKLQGEIEIKVKDNFLVISSGDDLFELNIMNFEEYPILDFSSIEGCRFLVDSKDIRKAIKNTIFATNSESIEFVLGCLNLVAKNSNLTISGTDKYRIATETIQINTNSEFDISIYAKKLKDFIPSNYDGEIEINVNEHKIETKIDNMLIQSKVVEFPYKDISNVFPKVEDLKYKIEIDKKELSDLINKATAISSDSNYKLEFRVNKDIFSISGHKDEMGSTLVKTKKFTFTNNNEFNSENEIYFCLNHKFLKESISVFEGTIHILVDKVIKRVLIISNSNKTNRQLIGTT